MAVVLTTNSEEVLVAVASDGAGSASRSEEGSDFVCSEMLRKAEEWLKVQPPPLDLKESVVEDWLLTARAALESKAISEGSALRDYSSTLLLAIVADNQALYVQIGDGAIVVGNGDTYSVMFWPENGEYANMTYFLTNEDFRDHIQILKTSSAPSELAILTDGLQRIALKYDSKTAYAPFFIPMFQKLRNEPVGMSDSLCLQLERFLSSPAINERTDDDKTLLLASKLEPNAS